MYVIGVPYFTGTQLPECDLLADSLADSAVARALDSCLCRMDRRRRSRAPR